MPGCRAGLAVWVRREGRLAELAGQTLQKLGCGAGLAVWVGREGRLAELAGQTLRISLPKPTSPPPWEAKVEETLQFF